MLVRKNNRQLCANPAALRTGNPLTFGDGRRLIAVTASRQIMVVIDMRVLHLDTLLQTADSASAR
jgi:hypothetical protein